MIGPVLTMRGRSCDKNDTKKKKGGRMWLILGLGISLMLYGGWFLRNTLIRKPPSVGGNVSRRILDNRIHLPKGYTKELFDTIREAMDQSNLSPQQLAALNQVEQIAQGGLDIPTNQYQPSPEEEQIVISDLNHLSPEVQQALSLFVTDLINDVREQMGVSGRLQVDEVSLGFAREVSKQYLVEPWDYTQGHHVAAINRAAKRFNLKEYPSNGYENLSVYSSRGSISVQTLRQGNQIVQQEYFYKQELKNNMTLAELKKVIYQALLRFLFDDGLNPRETSNKNTQGHAKALLAVGEFSNQGDSRFGLSISFSNQFYEADRDYHYEEGVSRPSLATRAIHLISFKEEDIKN